MDNLFVIDNILVDSAVITTKFLCDVRSCKGACCTYKGGRGAPVEKSELSDIEEAAEAAKEYLSPSSRAFLEQHGGYEEEGGEYFTRCIEEKDCVFVYYEDEIAKCSIERAHIDGKTPLRKPLSCHLYPIRLDDFGGPYTYYDKFELCAPALQYGKEHNVRLFEMLKEPLIRAHGEEWYAKLLEFALRQLNPDEEG